MMWRCLIALHELGRNFITHHFHIDNKEDGFGIVYGVIIGYDLMLQLGLMANFKHKVLEWDY